MLVQYLLLACLLFAVHIVSVASQLPVPAVSPERDKSVNTLSVKPPPHAKLRGKPASAPATVHMPIKKPKANVPVASDSAVQKK